MSLLREAKEKKNHIGTYVIFAKLFKIFYQTGIKFPRCFSLIKKSLTFFRIIKTLLAAGNVFQRN